MSLLRKGTAMPDNQFAPVYSQAIFKSMVERECQIGNYFNEPNCYIDVAPEVRSSMIELIQ